VVPIGLYCALMDLCQNRLNLLEKPINYFYKTLSRSSQNRIFPPTPRKTPFFGQNRTHW